MSTEVKIKTISGILPQYETKGAAAVDLRAFMDEDIVIEPGKRKLVPTGIFIELPAGYEAQVRARSGLAIRNGIGLVNGMGTIDCDYRGEIKVPLINWGEETFVIKSGDRIAQMLITKYEKIEWKLTDELGETERSDKGFGHTGV